MGGPFWGAMPSTSHLPKKQSDIQYVSVTAPHFERFTMMTQVLITVVVLSLWLQGTKTNHVMMSVMCRFKNYLLELTIKMEKHNGHLLN